MIRDLTSLAQPLKNHSKFKENGLLAKNFFACGALLRASGRPSHGRDGLAAKIRDPDPVNHTRHL